MSLPTITRISLLDLPMPLPLAMEEIEGKLGYVAVVTVPSVQPNMYRDCTAGKEYYASVFSPSEGAKELLGGEPLADIVAFLDDKGDLVLTTSDEPKAGEEAAKIIRWLAPDEYILAEPAQSAEPQGSWLERTKVGDFEISDLPLELQFFAELQKVPELVAVRIEQESGQLPNCKVGDTYPATKFIILSLMGKASNGVEYFLAFTDSKGRPCLVDDGTVASGSITLQ